VACGFLLQLNSTPIRWRRETINFSTYRILYRPMPATLIPPARLSDFLSTLRKTLMGSCSARASSLPSTFQGQTWFRPQARGINPQGDIVGFYVTKDASGVSHHTRIRRNQKQPERRRRRPSRLTKPNWSFVLSFELAIGFGKSRAWSMLCVGSVPRLR